MKLREKYESIRTTIDETCRLSGREPSEVTLVSVSKTYSAEVVQSAIDQGISLFGENRIQEAGDKIAQLHGEFSFHLIGHLQSNKAKQAVALFDLIHSIDKASTADKVSKEAEKIGKIQKVLIQVNTSNEESKSGIAPEDAISLCKHLLELPNIELQGLMTIGPLTDDQKAVRHSFQSLRLLKEQAEKELSIQLAHLSMGMSGDFTIAVEEGATLVRVGSAIFGKRDYI